MIGNELSLLALYGFVVALVLGLKTTGMIGQLGMGYMLSSRDEPRELGRMLARTDRAITNSITGLALVSVPILILGLTDRYTGQSLLAMQVFVAVRIAYFPAYVFGLTGVRTGLWLAGFVATLALYVFALF